MYITRSIFIAVIILILPGYLFAQNDKMAYLFSGVVYDEFFRPVPYTHVVASGTGSGDVTDSLGIFSLYIREMDQLSFFNISYRDTLTYVNREEKGFYINLKRRYYMLQEAKVFSWGSTYGEFLSEVKRQGNVTTEGERIGLPKQDPDYIPFNMDEKQLKSARFLISSPVSFFYYNLSKSEKSARKAYKLEKDRELIGQFEETMSEENISYITGLKGEELQRFMIYLNEHLMCTYHCSELNLLTEIYNIWGNYQETLKNK